MLKNTVRACTLAVVGLLALGALQTASAGLTNGSFENPVGGGFLDPTSGVPGWRAIPAAGNWFEVWTDPNGEGVPAYDGQQFVEINGNMPSTVYQDVSGITLGSVISFQFAHRGRLGVDTMQFDVTDLGTDNAPGGAADTVLFTGQYSDGNGAWGFYTGSTAAALGNNVRFSFTSVSTAFDLPSVGNFLDAADFSTPVPEPATLLLLGTGLVGLGVTTWRRARRK